MSSLTTPPHSIDAERSVLGSILIDRDGIIQVASLLTPADFYDPSHAIVYDAMLDLFSRNRPIDSVTVREIIDDKKQLEGIGGNAFLAELMSSVFTSANIFQYAQIIKNKSVLRKLIRAGNEIIMHGFDEAAETTELLEKSENSQSAIVYRRGTRVLTSRSEDSSVGISSYSQRVHRWVRQLWH